MLQSINAILLKRLFYQTDMNRAPLWGFFLCAESDEAFFCPAFFKFGSNPVETPGDPAAIVCVLVTVESLEEEHPLISAEMNGFSGR